MRRAALFAGFAVLCAGVLPAHGGQYRGPGGSTPPGPGGPGTPGVGRPATPGASPSGPLTPGSDVDRTRWPFWWELNKDLYLRPRPPLPGALPAGAPVLEGDGTVATMARVRPDRATTQNTILPVLLKVLAGTDDADLVTACLIAIARVDLTGREDEALAALRARFATGNQDVRETAALALGIAAQPASVRDLAAFVHDQPAAHRLLGRTSVDERTRSFAALGMGLAAGGIGDALDGAAAARERAWTTLTEILAQPKERSRDLQVEAVHGLRLLVQGHYSTRTRLAWRIVQVLEQYYAADLGRGSQILQAHVPLALAALLGDGAEREHDRVRARLAHDLQVRARREATVDQSIALALSYLGPLRRPEKGDPDVLAVLLQTAQRHRDLQTRCFAWLALGRIGGDAERAELERVCLSGRNQEQPFAALALGLHAHAQRRRGAAVPDASVRALLRVCNDEKAPDLLGAAALAAGFTRARAALPVLLGLLDRHERQDELAGHIALGLGLLGEREAVPVLRRFLERSLRRPEPLRNAAIALAELGDLEAVPLLVQVLEEPSASSVRLAAAAEALQRMGDQRAVNALVRVVEDGGRTRLARAFAAAALGGIAERTELPWHAAVAPWINHQAIVETLYDGRAGILDLL
ncbi:MAG: HEAT repeat domain-containing protein [Planctomycetes bacterium]|nr:HEAT repeat domain-containing protein [Planctomycetota bacterium]